jgi:hypothetical protein
MKITNYACDYCGKEVVKKHLSINFGGHSGWVDNVDFAPDNAHGWKHVQSFTRDRWIGQFCNGKCLEDYFALLWRRRDN